MGLPTSIAGMLLGWVFLPGRLGNEKTTRFDFFGLLLLTLI
jgi:hypothetical protein